MMQPACLHIAAIVATSERRAVTAAADRLATCLEGTTQQQWMAVVAFPDAPDAIDPLKPPDIVIISLLPELLRRGPCEQIAERLRHDIDALPGEGAAAAFLLTIFRHVDSVATRQHGAGTPISIERVRRLNLLAAELSQATGINVIDIDRVFAHAGAR